MSEPTNNTELIVTNAEFAQMPDDLLTKGDFTEAERAVIQYIFARKVQLRVIFEHEQVTGKLLKGKGDYTTINQIEKTNQQINSVMRGFFKKICVAFGIDARRFQELEEFVYDNETDM